MSIAGEFSQPLADWWDDFARSLRRRNRSPETADLYRRSYDRFWTWALGQGITSPAEVATRHVNEWVDQLHTEVAPTTVAIYWRNLRPFFSWWAKETDATNPFHGADTPSAASDPPPVIHLDDIRALLDACKGKGFEERRDNAIIRVLFDTGVRLGELVGLEVGHWDRRTDTLAVDGKSGKRLVSLSPSTGEALARYVRERGGHRMAEKTDRLWLGKKGALGDSGVAQLLARRSEQAGLGRINPHAFRHTFSHEFRAQGGSDVDLMYLAGWTSTTMAARYGASAAAERARDTHRRIGLGDRL